MAETAAMSWRPVAVLMATAIFVCLAPHAAAAEMAPSPSPSPGAGATPNGHLDEKVDLRLKLLNLRKIDLELEESELVGFQKYMDGLEVSVGGKGFRLEKTVWDLAPIELRFKLGVVFAQHRNSSEW